MHPGTMQLLRYENLTLFIDGTFRVVPSKFKQCIFIMVFDRRTKLYVPIFYILVTAKTSDTYWNVIQYASNASGIKIKPKEVVCDFEGALINTISSWFEGSRIIGCLFHLKQACRRRMKKERIPKPEAAIAMERGVLDMLTVLDPDNIPKVVCWVRKKIKDRCDEDGHAYSRRKWKSFWRYFQRTWIKLVPPGYWNVFDVRETAAARRNNSLERFNRELNAAFSTHHRSLPRFVQTIEEMSRKYVDFCGNITLGRARAPARSNRIELLKTHEKSEILRCTSSDDQVSDSDTSGVNSSDANSSQRITSSSDDQDQDHVEEYDDFVRSGSSYELSCKNTYLHFL